MAKTIFSAVPVGTRFKHYGPYDILSTTCYVKIKPTIHETIYGPESYNATSLFSGERARPKKFVDQQSIETIE